MSLRGDITIKSSGLRLAWEDLIVPDEERGSKSKGIQYRGNCEGIGDLEYFSVVWTLPVTGRMYDTKRILIYAVLQEVTDCEMRLNISHTMKRFIITNIFNNVRNFIDASVYEL